jgi:CBS domain-containing protein
MSHDLSLYTVSHTASIREAMERIEANKHRVVVVVDEENRVVGTVSDGDLRRAFLHDVLPIAPVTRIMQLNPHVTTETDPARRHEIIRDEQVTVLPVVTDDNHLVDVELAYEPDF